jgi:WD40 repeat protein
MRVFASLALVMTVAVISVAMAGEPPAAPAADEATIKKLVADLGRQEAAVRDAAQKRLVEIGIPSRPALLAAAQGDDPEVRTRAKAALGKLVEVTIADLGPGGSFSPDGRHVAYVAFENEKDRTGLQCMMYDGKAGPKYDSITTYRGSDTSWQASIFLPDGSLVYAAEKNGTKYLVTAGREGRAVELPSANPLLFWSDDKHVAYLVKRNYKEHLLYDGKEGPAYQGVSPGFFSPDGQILVYFASHSNDKQFVVVNGRPFGPHEGLNRWAFSPDGKRFAFVTSRKDKQGVVCADKDGPVYEGVGASFLFSPDSKNFAYFGREKEGADASLFLNGKPVPADKKAGPIGFTADSRQLILATPLGEVNGAVPPKVRIETYDLATGKIAPLVTSDGFPWGCPVFSPDGKHLASYTHDDNGRVSLTVDNKPLPPVFDHDSADGPGSLIPRLDPPGFSADGRHVFCRGVRETRDPYGMKRFMVVDGQPRPEHDNLWIPANFQNGVKTLRYIVVDNGKYRLVETYWPEDRTWEGAAKDKK